MGIHNATLAIVVAQSVLLSTEMSLPAAIYGVLMFFIAGIRVPDQTAGGSGGRAVVPVEPSVRRHLQPTGPADLPLNTCPHRLLRSHDADPAARP